ncbi:MAG: hypothetical protein JSS79_10730 [Bacteroidetes bacterium]|nr:hypothetical protein [Bacteroidota bacterium]
MKTGIFGALFLAVLLLGEASCRKSEYTRMAEAELAKGIRNDSLFLGIHFGMKKEEFFQRCAALNKRKLTTMGRNANVLYKLENETGTIDMNFYPKFSDDQIYEMNVLFNYENWDPWARNLQPDSLQFRVKRIFEKWYGPGFIKVENPSQTKIKNDFRTNFAFVKIDGNRQVIIFCDGEMDVKAVITDLVKKAKVKQS